MLAFLGIAVIAGRDLLGYLGIRLAGATGCAVVRVVDGDTVRSFCPGRGFESVRLLGYDTPEVFSPSCLAEWWAGTKATWALRSRLWIAGKVELIFSGTDRYDRRLATLLVDGRNIANAMIASGHGRRYGGKARQGWCA